MKRILSAALVMAMTATNSLAGGLLTNTNQNVAFLRNPSRDAAIGIDGVYSNPAGVAFMPEGIHLSFNLQSAWQTRTVTSTFGGFKFGVDNNGQVTKKFEGEANAPVVPSVQAAINRGKWSFQASFAVTGGGGKCIFDKGLGSFESVVSLIPMLAPSLGLDISGYDYDSYLKGRQYYFGLQLGSAYRVTDWLSAYAGVRLSYGSANYHGYLRDIRVKTGDELTGASDFFGSLSQKAIIAAAQCAEAAEQYAAAGDAATAAKYEAMAQQYTASARTAGALSKATSDVTLNCDQTGFGAAPTIGLHAKVWHLDFAVKYDFRTKMNLKNVSANSESANNLTALAKFADGAHVREDSPALLTVGAAWQIIKQVRISAGYHHFFDKSAKSYGDKQKLLDGGTNEVLAGIDYDVCDRLQLSVGLQSTNYQFTDEYMSDISFTTSSYTIGCGAGIRINDHVKINVAYFQTNYDTYNKTTSDYGNLSQMIGAMAGTDAASALVSKGALAGSDSFSRTNKAFGLGVDLSF
ncbi:MAG: outer membrane protein transport protein [Bacteroidales bacterium]|nr:outer membrane protein transport protein [Bacteroidales bacterium]